jgi:hypothetical protein
MRPGVARYKEQTAVEAVMRRVGLNQVYAMDVCLMPVE